MSGPHETDDEVTLRTLLALVETQTEIAEHGHDRLSRTAGREGVEARLRRRLAGPPPAHDDTTPADDLDWDLWLLLETTVVEVRSGPGVETGPVRVEDPATGALVTVRAGAEAGTWTVSLSRASAGRYRIRLACGQDAGRMTSVEITARDGRTTKATARLEDAPDRVRVERLDG